MKTDPIPQNISEKILEPDPMLRAPIIAVRGASSLPSVPRSARRSRTARNSPGKALREIRVGIRRRRDSKPSIAGPRAVWPKRRLSSSSQARQTVLHQKLGEQESGYDVVGFEHPRYGGTPSAQIHIRFGQWRGKVSLMCTNAFRLLSP